MIQNNDQTEAIQQSVTQAIDSRTPLQIVAGASKSFYGRIPQGQELSIARHQGIVNYHPSELVITARTGTLLSDIEATLAEQGQMLAFEPPYFSPSATIGGAIACGFSGARRPFTGSVRDFVLGCKIINGKAEVLSFGGEVMKNVAGYDVSRLMVGALGTLGVLLEVSLKVLPKPAVEITRLFELNTTDALAKMQALSQQSFPLSGLNYDGQTLALRLSGTEKTLQQAGKNIGGDELKDAALFWRQCIEQQHDFFKTATDLWRFSVPASTPEIALSGDWFYEWGGAQRWLKTTEPKQTIFSMAETLEGHASLFRTQHRSSELFQPLPSVLKKLNGNIKMAFDPLGLFNPYRMTEAW